MSDRFKGLEGGLNSTSMLLAVSSALDPKVFCSYITSVLLSGVGVGFLFGGIVGKLNRLSSQGDW